MQILDMIVIVKHVRCLNGPCARGKNVYVYISCIEKVEINS